MDLRGDTDKAEGVVKTEAEIRLMRLEPRSTGGHWKLEEVRTRLEPSAGSEAQPALGFRFLVSRVVRQCISVVASQEVCGNSLWQP